MANTCAARQWCTKMNLVAHFSAEVAADCCFFNYVNSAYWASWIVGPAVRCNAACVALHYAAAFSRSCPLYRGSISVCWDTACSEVLLEKLTVSQLVKKFSTSYGALKFIAVFTTAHHLSQSWATLIRSTPSHLRLGPASGLFIFLSRQPVCIYLLPHTCYIQNLSHNSWFDHPSDIWWAAQTTQLLIMRFHLASCHFPPPRKKLRADWGWGMLAIIPCRIFYLPVCYPKS
jgi:hypothetical protein